MPSTSKTFRAFDALGYNATEATADFLDLSPSYLNKSRLTGDGPPFVKFGHAVKYFGPAVVAWAESRMRRSTSDQGKAA